jgi:pyridoxamine 5'-phosphate oxidase
MTQLRFTDRLPDELPDDPMPLADAWIREAMANAGQRNANSMTLATVGADGQPSVRVVLCKQLVPDPGYLVFYTNYRSRKARELAANPKISAAFYWDNLGLQVRVEGVAVRSPEDESDAYFATRETGSKLGAWGSDQSEPVGSRAALLEQIRQRAASLGIALDTDSDASVNSDAKQPEIARPPHWGGIRIWATGVELWVEGRDRIHDRAVWTRAIEQAGDHEFSVSPWHGTRLQP